MLRSVSVSATSRSTTGSTTGSCRRAEARAADGVSRSRRRSSGSANNELRARRGSRLEPNHLLQEVQFEATVPALRDRVVQMALKLVLEPILESDFHASSYGYRPGRRTQDAIAEIVLLANHPASYECVIEADVEACFDRLDHRAIMAGVERRIGDRRVLALLRAFLKAGVMTEAGRLERRLTGTPQGGIISPLLMNVALDALDREFEATPNERRQLRRKGLASCRLIRYADDFVVMVKGSKAQAKATMATLADSLARMGLVLSATKTGLTHIDGGFDFLGFRIVRKPRENKRPCVYTFVSDEALASVKRKVAPHENLCAVSGSSRPPRQCSNDSVKAFWLLTRICARFR